MCHQNSKVVENPPVPSNELSPIVVAKGICGIKWAIGVSHLTEFDFIMHGFVDVVLIRCVMGQFCRMLHGKGCVPGKILTRSNKGIGWYC